MNCILSQNPVAKRMKGRNPHLRVPVRHCLVNALLHFLGGFFGKGESKNMLGRYVFFEDKIGNAMRYDRCFACSRSRNNKKRPFSKQNCLFLLFIKFWIICHEEYCSRELLYHNGSLSLRVEMIMVRIGSFLGKHHLNR